MFFTKREESAKKIDEVLSQKEFNSVIIDFTTLNFRLEAGSKFEVRFKGYEDEKPNLSFEKGTLKIKQIEKEDNDPHIHILKKEHVNLVISNEDMNEVVVIVPKDKSLEALQVNLVAGDGKISQVTTNDVNATFISGDLTVKEERIDNFKANLQAGDLTLKEVGLGKGKIKLAAGDFQMKDGRIIQSLEVKTSTGDNLVQGTQVDRCELSTTLGENRLFGQDKNNGEVGSERDGSLLILKAVTGDNIVK